MLAFVAWCRRWGEWILAALLVCVGAGGMWSVLRRRKIIQAAQDSAAVQAAQAQVVALQHARFAVERKIGATAAEIRQLDQEIAISKTTLSVELQTSGLTAQEVADAFAKLGY